MSPLLRYTLLQLPGLGFVALIALALWRFSHVPEWIAAMLVVLWAAKDVVMYPFVRGAYAGPGGPGTARLVGQCGVARQSIAPNGYVSVGSELWRAEAQRGSGPIAAGSRVRVVGARRLTLIVVPFESDDDACGTESSRADR